MSLSVYSTRNLTFPPKKYNEEAKRGVDISACENCGKTFKKLSDETNMINHVVYLLRVTNVSGNSLLKKYLMDTRKQNTPSN